MKIKHAPTGGFRIVATNGSFFVALHGDAGSTWGEIADAKIFDVARDARAARNELLKRGLPMEIDQPTAYLLSQLSAEDLKKRNRAMFRKRLCQKHERIKQQISKATVEVRKAVPLGAPLPSNKVYQEPDREPIDRLAASMFWRSNL